MTRTGLSGRSGHRVRAAQGTWAGSVPENGVTAQAGLRAARGAACWRRGGGGRALLHVSPRGLARPQNPCVPRLRCRKEPAAGPSGRRSVTVRAEAWGEVACPQELGGLAHAPTRAGSPTALRRELRTPPRGEASWQTCGSRGGWNPLPNCTVLSSSLPRDQAAPPRGFGSAEASSWRQREDLRGWEQGAVYGSGLGLKVTELRKSEAENPRRPHEEPAGCRCPSSSRQVRCKWGDSACGSSSSCRSGRCWRS